MNFFKKLMELKRLLGYNKVYNNLEKKKYILVLKKRQNAPPGMHNFKITWGRSPRPPRQEGETPPRIPIAGPPHLCSGYLIFSSCYFFTNWKPCNSWLSLVNSDYGDVLWWKRQKRNKKISLKLWILCFV